MKIAPVFEKVFGRLYGELCWGVRPGHGSFLTLEFGKPHLEIRERAIAKHDVSAGVRSRLASRRVDVRGEWNLWIYCCDWEVLSAGKHIGDSSTKVKIRAAADFLGGQKLVRFSQSARNSGSEFEFDLGAKLRTRPYDSKSEQWMLFEPSRKVLLVRADGRYVYQHSDRPKKQDGWRPIQVGAVPTRR
jgi:hypothetical protein